MGIIGIVVSVIVIPALALGGLWLCKKQRRNNHNLSGKPKPKKSDYFPKFLRNGSEL
jgi:hypothetical protein